MVQAATTILALEPADLVAFEYLHRKTSCVESVTCHHRRLTVKTFRILERVHSMCNRDCYLKKKALSKFLDLSRDQADDNGNQ